MADEAGGVLGWGTTAGIFAVVTAFFLMLSLLGSKERPEYAEQVGLPIWPALKATFANWSFVTFVAASMLVNFTFVQLTAAIPFYAKYVLKATGFQTTLMLGAIFVVALPLVYVWGRLIIRWGPRTAMLAATALFAVLLVPFWFVSGFLSGLLVTASMALGLSGLLVLIDVLVADIVDEDRLQTGRRREGMYFGVHGLMIRLGISLQAVITGQILTRSGYDANLAVQPEAAVTGLRLLVTVVPMAALALAVIAMWLYPLHGKRLQEVRSATPPSNP